MTRIILKTKHMIRIQLISKSFFFKTKVFLLEITLFEYDKTIINE